MKNPLPADATILRSYRELERYVAAFAAGHINLLILIGAPGLSKSRTVRSVLGSKACWIEGNATALGMYIQLYEHRDRFIVIDDVDSLYGDRNGVRLLKCLCQTETVKSVSWFSTTRALEKAGIPREFTTRSRAVIISNDWRTLNQNVAALQDRGHVLAFCPSAAEVHTKAMTWFDDAEIANWFAANLSRILAPSLRHYLRAAELKDAALDWTRVIQLASPNRRQQLVYELRRDDRFANETARVQEFTARGGGCRATYFNYVRRLRANRALSRGGRETKCRQVGEKGGGDYFKN